MQAYRVQRLKRGGVSPNTISNPLLEFLAKLATMQIPGPHLRPTQSDFEPQISIFADFLGDAR